MSRACLFDTTRCIGCRACQVACKQWNELSAETTSLRPERAGFQNPLAVSAKTFAVVTFHEVADKKAPGEMRWLFTKRQCMHCLEPSCASACPVTALHKTTEGPVAYDVSKCIGCRYCVGACPFGAPTAEWDSLAPKIRKCTGCLERSLSPSIPEVINGQAADKSSLNRYQQAQTIPACVKACPTGCLLFGERDALLVEAHRRIKETPTRYVDHVYGEKEVGGTGALYLSSVPFAERGFRTDLGDRGYPKYSEAALKAVAPAVVGLGAVLGGVYWITQRREQIKQEQSQELRIKN
ncbi:MAG: 4Fe-4S dicluster domain-containing protein [Planctomycetota bacterium]